MEIKNRDGAGHALSAGGCRLFVGGGGGRTVFYSGFPFCYFGVKMSFYEMMIIVCSSWCRVFRFGFNGLIWQNNPLAVLSKSLEFVELKNDPGI